jgi:peptidoglycan/xylan/chitin deacetylase (PgdA/CDA1 family)
MLYAEWSNRDSLIVTYDQILEDIKANARELEKFGVSKENSSWFLPPYEYYNRESVQLTESLGYKVLNYTPGTATPADYTTPSMKSYKSSQQLIDKLYAFEKQNGLNGAIILIHPGVAEERTDRLYNRLGEIIEEMKLRGYNFKSLNEIE